jgi:outer membrane protein assembly factor BamB
LDVTAEPFVAGLEILASDSALLEGHALRLSVRAWDIERRPTVPPRLTWGSGDPGVLTVDSAGTARAMLGGGGGDVAVWASAGPGQAADTITMHVAVHGEVKWRLPLGPMPLHGGPAEGPDGTVYVLGQTSLSLPEATLFAVTPWGTVSWQRRLTQVDCCNYPFVGRDGAVYVVGQYVWAFSPDGTLRWAITERPVEVFPNVPTSHAGAIGDDGTLYAAMAYDLFALRAADGDTLWVGPRAADAGWLLPPTVSADGRTAYISNTGDWFYGFDGATGTARWALMHTDPGLAAYGVGAALAGGRLLIPAATVLQEADTSGTLWGVGPVVGRGVSEPAVAPDGTLYLQTPQRSGVFALNPVASTRWSLPPRARWIWYGGPALAAGGVLYAAATDGLYALNVTPDSASVRWRYPGDTTQRLVFVGAPLISADGTVYSFTSCDYGRESLPCSDELFAFWEDKPVEPNSPWPMWRHDARRSGQAHR